MSLKLYKPFSLGIVILFSILTCLSPIYPEQMFLQHFATIIIAGFLIYDIKIDFLSKTAFTGILLFMVLHAIGARYIYSMVPYNDWSLNILGWDMQSYFGWERNHYDRLVHFLFGVLILPFSVEFVTKKFNIHFRAALLMGLLLIQTFSMFYEIFEWLLTVFLSDDQAENYNGQQGDPWDAHKDMALAMLGSVLCAVGLVLKSKEKQ